jgi:hypothetical protein
MRLPAIASLAGFAAMLAAAAPCAAAGTTLQLQYNAAEASCEEMNGNREFTKSLVMCQGAAAIAKRQEAATKSWWSYDGESQSLEEIALDESGLGHHRLAYKTAVQSHRLSYYVLTYFTLEPDDTENTNARIRDLVAIEATESAYIRRGIGD